MFFYPFLIIFNILLQDLTVLSLNHIPLFNIYIANITMSSVQEELIVDLVIWGKKGTWLVFCCGNILLNGYPISPIAIRNYLTNQFFQKKVRFCIFSTTKKSWTSLYRYIHPGDSWPYIFANITMSLNFFFDIYKSIVKKEF